MSYTNPTPNEIAREVAEETALRDQLVEEFADRPKSRLTEDEANAVRFAGMPGLVPMERLELLDFLRYPETLPPAGTERVKAVVEQILRNRGFES